VTGAANEQVVFTSAVGDVSFSARGFERKITNMPKLFELIGEDTFLKIAKVTLTDVDKYLGTAEKDKCLEETLTGPRKISVVPKEKLVTQD
jgi:hypothetical protein